MASDSELAIAAASGDRGALADIYDRYGNTGYELCRVILSDPRAASDALQDTFVSAAGRLSGLGDPARLKPWFSAIARHESIRRSSKRRRTRPARDEVLDVPVMDDAAAALVAHDAASLVWESVESLTERERFVLELNVRQGLAGADLAAAAGLPGPATSVLLSRAKTQLASAVRCTLLVRNGRGDCVELASIVPRKHASIDSPTRKRVARHASTCPICATKWNATPEALGVLAAAPLLGAPVALRHKVLNDPRLISFSRALGDGDWQRDGFPPPETDGSRRRIVAWLAAAAAVLLVVVGLVAASGDDDGTSLASPRARTTTPEVEEFAPWPTDPSGERITTSSVKRSTTTTRRPTTTTTRVGTGNGGGAAPTTPPPAPETTTTTTQALTISAGIRENTLRCNTSGNVTATTSGASPSMLFVQWRDSSGSGGGSNMEQTGPNTWRGTAGPMTHAGTWTWWVSTSFTGGGTRSSNHTIEVIC